MTTEEKKQQTCTVSVRARTPDGFDAEVRMDDVPSAGATELIRKVSSALREHGFGPLVTTHQAPEPTGAEAILCETCKGPTEFKRGEKNGKAWAAYFCIATAKAPKDLQHKPKWVAA